MTEDKELTAMKAVAEAFNAVKDEEELTARVLQWINSRYGKVKAVPAAAGRVGKSDEVEDESFTDVAALVAAAGPKTDPERALVAGYWFQVRGERKDFDAQLVNTALKQLGYPSSNITSAFTSLSDRKPVLVLQVDKKGKTKQGRKKYRLTTAGLEAVRHMLSDQAEEDSTGR